MLWFLFFLQSQYNVCFKQENGNTKASMSLPFTVHRGSPGTPSQELRSNPSGIFSGQKSFTRIFLALLHSILHFSRALLVTSSNTEDNINFLWEPKEKNDKFHRN